tara:strand:+ start:532 stop:846 length:315 start_codon:yes stop_codon:yes gene_type:complete
MTKKLTEIYESLNQQRFSIPTDKTRLTLSPVTDRESLQIMNIALMAMDMLRYGGWESEALKRSQINFYENVLEQHPLCDTYQAKLNRGMSPEEIEETLNLTKEN